MKGPAGKKRKAGPAEVSCRPAKRSADEISSRAKPAVGRLDASSDAPARADEIPAPVWGHVMDYLPYTDVLQCLLVNRMLSFEAPAFVDELNIFKSCELQILPLFRNHRRFENASEVNIFCLLDEVPRLESENPTQKLNLDALNRLVPFLECFPKLKYCYCGGWDCNASKEVNFNMYECTGPEDHVVGHYSQLLRQFSSAFEKGSLPRFLALSAVLEGIASPMTCRELGTNNECSFCSRICSTFPLNCLLGLYHEIDHLCLDDCTLIKCIRGRKWSRECFEAASPFFCDVVGLERVAVNEEYRKDLIKRKALDPNHIYFLSKSQLERMQFMVDLGLDIGTWGETPEDATKEYLLGKMKGIFPLSNWGFALTKSTFDVLIQVGYPFDETDFVLVDEASEPYVKDLNFVDIPQHEEGEENDSETEEDVPDI